MLFDELSFVNVRGLENMLKKVRHIVANLLDDCRKLSPFSCFHQIRTLGKSRNISRKGSPTRYTFKPYLATFVLSALSSRPP